MKKVQNDEAQATDVTTSQAPRKGDFIHTVGSQADRIDIYLLNTDDPTLCTPKAVAEALGLKQSRVAAHLYHLRTKRSGVCKYENGLYRLDDTASQLLK